MSAEFASFSPWTWQEEFGFPQARQASDVRRMVFCTGQAATDGAGHAVHAGDMSAQLRQSFDNLNQVLAAAGVTMRNVVRLTVYTTDVDELFAIWDELKAHLHETQCQPALTLLGVTRLAYPDLLVEIEATAAA